MKKTSLRILSLVLVIVMLSLSLVSCGGDDEEGGSYSGKEIGRAHV